MPRPVHPPPEDGVGVFVEVVEEVLDAGAGVQGLVVVELQVPVAPVQRPEAGGLGVVQACDREPGPLGAEVVAPGWSALADRQVAGRDVALDADLTTQPLRDLAAHHRCTRATSSSGSPLPTMDVMIVTRVGSGYPRCDRPGSSPR